MSVGTIRPVLPAQRLARPSVEIGPWQAAGLAAIGLALLGVTFAYWSATTPWSFLQFVLAVIVLGYLPGKLIIDLGRLRLSALEEFTLALLLGLMVSDGLFWVVARLAMRKLFVLWPVLIAAGLIWRHRQDWRQALTWRATLDRSHVLLAGLIVLALLPLALLPMYFQDMDMRVDGTLTYSVRPPDIAFHQTIANELTLNVPPQIPFFAGQPLNYHYAYDLLMAMFSQTAFLATADLVTRFLPTLFTILTVLAVFCFSRAWLRSPYQALLVALLVFFGEDFSFIPGLLLQSTRPWSAQYFTAPTTYNLYLSNPMLPALGLLFAGLLCLARFLSERRWLWAVLAGTLLAALIMFKIFAAAQLGLAMAGAAGLYLLWQRDTGLLKAGLVTAGLMLPIMVGLALRNQESSHIAVQLGSSGILETMLKELRLADWPIFQGALALLNGAGVSLGGALVLALLVLPIFFIGSLGARLLGLPGIVRALVKPQPGRELQTVLALFVVLGPLLTLALRIVPDQVPDALNNSFWFYIQSKYLLWLFVVPAAAALLRNRSAAVRAASGVGLALLVLPSSLQYIAWRSQDPLTVLSRNDLALIDYLRPNCAHGAVLMNREPSFSMPLMALTRCRQPVLDLYLNQQVAAGALAQRLEDYYWFWGGWDKQKPPLQVLARYNVSFLVIATVRGDGLPAPALLEGPRGLRLCYQNADYHVYGPAATCP